MPIVGEAIIRVRVIGDRVGPDIARAVRQGVRDAEADIDASGERTGTRWGNALNQGVRRGAAARREEGDRAGNDLNEGLRRRVNRDRVSLANLFGKTGREMMSNFRHEFNLGIGAARMGPAILSAIALAAPSLLSGFAALGSALVSSLVTQIAAAGPFIAGALGVMGAAVSTAALNFGLLFAAFKAGNAELDAAVARFKALGKAIGAPIAEGFAAGFTDMVSSLERVLPQINSLLRETGEAFGNVARRIGETVSSAENVGRIQGILATNKTFIDNFGVGLSGLTSSFLTLFNAAKPFVDLIGESIAKFGQWAERTLAAKEANGELATFMSNLTEAFKTGAQAIGDFVVGLYNVLKAAAPVGGGFVELAAKFREWTGDPANQERMTAFFEKMSVLTSALVGLFVGLASAAGGALEKMDLTNILAIFQILTDKIAPALADLWNQVQSGAGDNLVRIFDNLGTALGKIVDSGSFETIARLASEFLLKISEFAASDFGSTVLGWVLPLALFGGTFASVLSSVSSLASAIAGLGAAVLAPLALIAGGFALLYTNSESFRTAIAGLGEDIASRFGPVWEELQPKLEKAWTALQRLASVIGDFLAPVIERIGPLIGAAFEFIATVLGDAFAIIGDMLTIFAAFFTGDWEALWEGVKSLLSDAWELIKDIIGGALEVIWNLILSVGALIATIWTAIWNGVSSVVVAVWNGIYAFFEMILTTIYNAVYNFGMSIPPFLASIWQWVQDTAIAVWNAIYAFFETILTTIYNGIYNFGMAIPPFLASIWQWVQDTAIAVWNAIYAFFESILTTIYNGIVNFGNAIPPFLEGIWNWVRDTAEAVWNAIWDLAESIWSSIVTAIESIVEPIVGWLQEKWDAITSAVSTAWDGLSGIVSGIWEAVSSAITGPIEAAWNRVTEVVGWIADAVSGILETVTSAFDTVNTKIGDMMAAQAQASALSEQQILQAGPLQTPFSKIEHVFGEFLGNVRLDIPFGGALARGGVVPAVAGGQMFQLGEAGRRERVEPLDSQGLSTRDRALISFLVKSMLPQKPGGGGTSVTVRIGERELTDVVTDVAAARDNDLARRARLRRAL